MPRERTIYKAHFRGQSDKARQLATSPESTQANWIPKSVFMYYSNDGSGNVKFSVEGWKEREIEAAGFEEA